MKYASRVFLLCILVLLVCSPVKTANDDLVGEKCGTANPAQLCDPPFIICSGGKCKHKDVFSMELKEFFGF